MFSISSISKKLIEKLRRKPYRDAYVSEHVRRGISAQIRAMRDQRGWSQGKLSELLGKPQSVVSRLEDPNYGKVTVQTLLEVAFTLDVALSIRFVSFPTFLAQTRDLSGASMNVDSFGENVFSKVADWAAGISGVYSASPDKMTLWSSQQILPTDQMTAYKHIGNLILIPSVAHQTNYPNMEILSASELDGLEHQPVSGNA